MIIARTIPVKIEDHSVAYREIRIFPHNVAIQEIKTKKMLKRFYKKAVIKRDTNIINLKIKDNLEAII